MMWGSIRVEATLVVDPISGVPRLKSRLQVKYRYRLRKLEKPGQRILSLDPVSLSKT